MIKTQYFCDNCKKETGYDNLWTLSVCVEYGAHSYKTSYASITTQRQAQWCRECVERVKLLPQAAVPKTEEIQEPTFEDLIRRIVNEELAAQ